LELRAKVRAAGGELRTRIHTIFGVQELRRIHVNVGVEGLVLRPRDTGLGLRVWFRVKGFQSTVQGYGFRV
jgi:hypothetical protein